MPPIFLSQDILGHYPEQHFSCEATHATMIAFREDLVALTKKIKARNKKIEIPYDYLRPDLITNCTYV